jgi:hypothetical protein
VNVFERPSYGRGTISGDVEDRAVRFRRDEMGSQFRDIRSVETIEDGKDVSPSTMSQCRKDVIPVAIGSARQLWSHTYSFRRNGQVNQP